MPQKKRAARKTKKTKAKAGPSQSKLPESFIMKRFGNVSRMSDKEALQMGIEVKELNKDERSTIMRDYSKKYISQFINDAQEGKFDDEN